LAEAERLGREYLQYISLRDRRRYYTSGNLDLVLAEVLLERNDLAAAEALVCEGLQQNKSWNIPQAVMLGYLRLVQVQLAQGNLSAAKETLAASESFLVNRALPPDVENERRILRLTLDAAQGKQPSSREWASNLPGEFSDDYRLEADYLILARLLIEEKQFVQAASLLEQLKIQAQTGRRTGRLVKILLLQALARNGMEQRSAAFAALEKCLDLAAPEGFLRTFLDEGEPARELLAIYRRHSQVMQQKYLAHILEVFPKRDSVSAPENVRQTLITPLTPRELEVLRCLAQGDSNQVIAEKLFITLSSVKKHTGNIYSKLEVESRTHAIARSRELGLI
jgi:LuxR family maltose regulon positive regulatory protein